MEVPFKVVALILVGVYYIVKNEWMNKWAMHRPLVKGGHTLRLFHMPEVHRWEKTKSVSTWTLPKFVQRAALGGGSWAKLASDCPGLEKIPFLCPLLTIGSESLVLRPAGSASLGNSLWMHSSGCTQTIKRTLGVSPATICVLIGPPGKLNSCENLWTIIIH